ncbi:MAG: ADOP family duplicated permease [Vicinamibacterales bacterium]
MRTFFSRLLNPLLRRARDRRLDEEVQAHLDLLTDALVAKGMTRDDARLAARKSFGGVDQMKATYRDRRGFRTIDELTQDVRYAFRLIARDRWFTAATVVALSLGIGATSTLVTLLYCMNFRGLPFHEARSLVGITGEWTRSQGGRIPFGIFDAWRSASRSFEAIAAEADSPINLGDEGLVTDQFGGTYLSFNGFAMLRERPVLGREFLPEDDRSGAAPVVIIGYRVWTDRYGADPGVIGRSVRVNGEPATIVGVMPDGFAYPIETQVWRPLAALPALATPAAAARPMRVVGRLARGVSPEQARAELAAIVSTLGTVPEADRTRRTIIMPLNETYVGKATQPAPMMMMAAVLVVLLIACSHAASLLIARSATRGREMSMRAALGAGRGRLVRQLLAESVLMALLAGTLGIAMAAGFARAFAIEVTGFGLPYWTRFTFDVPLVAIITALCLFTGIAFGLLPALHQSRTNLNDVLNQGGRSGIGSPRAQRMTAMLLIGEVALTMILLSAASALVRSANGVYAADQAIDVANLWEFRVALPQSRYAGVEQQRAFYAALDERLAGAPDVPAATLATSAPFNARDSRGIVMDNESPADRNPARDARFVAIGDRYFETLGLSLVRGRRFADLDAGARATAAIVNERFVQRYSPDADPIGRDVLLVNERTPDAAPARVTIVGIAPPLRQQIAAGHTPVVYVPFDAQPAAIASLLIRGNPERFAPAVRNQVRQLDADLPVFNLQSLERISYMSRWIPRIMGFVFSIVAIIATVLSALGLYALTAYATSRRTQEIGVRMALGAQRSEVSWLFLRQALRRLAIGLTIGLAGAIAIGGVLQRALVDVRANDPLMLAAVAAFLVAIATTAALVPSRRAARLDPVTALRQD